MPASTHHYYRFPKRNQLPDRSMPGSLRHSTNWLVKVESSLRVPLLLQSPQSLKPPRFVPIDLLESLVGRGVIRISVETTGCLALDKQLPRLFTISSSDRIVLCGSWVDVGPGTSQRNQSVLFGNLKSKHEKETYASMLSSR